MMMGTPRLQPARVVASRRCRLDRIRILMTIADPATPNPPDPNACFYDVASDKWTVIAPLPRST
jgi:hypothetical protein